ncbi:MAG: HyaD/HybD family hydrogenase maturation endopeptidase [Nitrospirae bacterium]|nr:HyaD/HybD family hydrogenase maturation endopeptidase [Nitrospirota bacterium]
MTGAPPSIVVLGVGNTLMQDDGIGVWAVRTLAETYDLPARVRLIDGGVAGLRCLSEFEGAEHLLIIDAVSGQQPPGTIYHLTPEELSARRGPFFSAHEVGVAELLSVARFLGRLPLTRILGVQPQEVREIGLDLTPVLRAVLPRVVDAAVGELESLGVKPVRKVDAHA